MHKSSQLLKYLTKYNTNDKFLTKIDSFIIAKGYKEPRGGGDTPLLWDSRGSTRFFFFFKTSGTQMPSCRMSSEKLIYYLFTTRRDNGPG